MKLLEGFVLKNIAGANIVVPVGSNTVSFNAVITLNESGAFLWQQLESDKTEEELVVSMLEEYDVDEATARCDVKEFVETLNKAGLLA